MNRRSNGRWGAQLQYNKNIIYENQSRTPHSFEREVLQNLVKMRKWLQYRLFQTLILTTKWTDGQTDGEVHNYNMLKTTYIEIKITRLLVSAELCSQNLGQPWDVHTGSQTDGQV